MRPYAVILRQPNRAVEERIQDAFPKHRFELSSTVHFVAAEGAITADIARKVGLKGGDRITNASGLVLRVTAYSGWTDSALWEWFSDVSEVD